jgi:heterodisulfide reductase subunit B
MEYAFYPGCLAQTEQYGCILSAGETLRRLGVELKNMDGSSCCGFQSYRLSAPIMWNFLTARNMALAERMGLDILTICNDCYLSFQLVKRQLYSDHLSRRYVNESLELEGLSYHNDKKVHHIIEVLHDEVGVDKISDSVTKPLEKYRFVTQPGCHLYRPKKLEMPDTDDPQKLDNLIEALGADTIDYPEKLHCCGASMYSPDDISVPASAERKLKSISALGIDGIVTTCPHCYNTLEATQRENKNPSDYKASTIPVIHFTQLLGLAMGIKPERLGPSFKLPLK